jgi:hypothetical protein
VRRVEGRGNREVGDGDENGEGWGLVVLESGLAPLAAEAVTCLRKSSTKHNRNLQ